MVDKFEYKGKWFLPEKPEDRISGILKFDSYDGAKLELIGNFEHPLNKDGIILGITSESKLITLYRSFFSSHGSIVLLSDSETGPPLVEYSANFILENVHLSTGDEFKFQEIRAEINNIDEWLNITGFAIKDDPTKYEIDLKYKLPSPIKFSISHDLEGQFNFVLKPAGRSAFTRSVTLNQRVELLISSRSYHDLDTILDYMFFFQNFLILASYEKTLPIAISLLSDKILKYSASEEKTKKRISVYFSISSRSRKNRLKAKYEMLFNYDSIKPNFDTIIQNWYKSYQTLRPTYNLLFEQFFQNERFSENSFLNLAQAAESFHRTITGKKKPNLKERLTELVTIYSNKILDNMISDKVEFVNQILHSRNYYTHYSKPGLYVLKGFQLFILSEKLKALLVNAILIEVGLDKMKLEAGYDNLKYMHFSHLHKWR
jgi:hypothetical protein